MALVGDGTLTTDDVTLAIVGGSIQVHATIDVSSEAQAESIRTILDTDPDLSTSLGTIIEDVSASIVQDILVTSSPPPPSMPWASCTSDDLVGDFNRRNEFTLGDAIYVAQMWAGEVPQIDCFGLDFNQKNGFTLGDAVFVAEVWAGLGQFPWM